MEALAPDVKILVVDNGSQWTHREWRQLRDLGVESEIIPNDTPLSEIGDDVDGLVLSGGAARIAIEDQDLSGCAAFLDSDVPVLGICAGHQFMALHFGGKVTPSEVPEFGATEITVAPGNDPLFDDIPSSFQAWTSHNDEVVELPGEFELLASSETTPIQAMRHKSRPLFGIQFHPEVAHTDHGETIFRNFVEICRERATAA